MDKRRRTERPAAGPTRRALLGAAALSLPVWAWAQAFARSPAAPVHVEVWKSPTCGCCQAWIEHLEANGFKVKVHDVGNTAARQRLGMPASLGSCHTAQVGRWTIEGHVPAADIHRLIREAPQAVGLAVPGMPVGSPGMDGPEYGGRRDPYDVLLVGLDGRTRPFRSYR